MNHHHVFKYISGTNQPFLFIDVLFLMTVGFIPWATAVLAESLRSGPERELAVTVYLVILVTMAWMFNAFWFTARAFGFTRDGLDPGHSRVISLSYPLGAGIMTISMLISFVSSLAAISIYVLLVAFYIVRGPEAQLRRSQAT